MISERAQSQTTRNSQSLAELTQVIEQPVMDPQ